MEDVAKHLSTYAIANYTDETAKLFVRSACNRYYYHVYLVLREEAFNLLDTKKRFAHGSDASTAIHGSYKKKIKDKLVSMNYVMESELVEQLVKDLIQKFTCLCDIRHESDYSLPTVDITSTEAKISFRKDTKVLEYSIVDIEKSVSEIVDIVEQLGAYRQMAGF